jgi:hypothetical protein
MKRTTYHRTTHTTKTQKIHNSINLNHKQMLGLAAIAAGIAIIIGSLGYLIIRILLALVGLVLINYGLFLRNQPPFFVWIQRIIQQAARMRR